MKTACALGVLVLGLSLWCIVCFRQACVTGEFALAYSHNHVNIMTGRQRCTP